MANLIGSIFLCMDSGMANFKGRKDGKRLVGIEIHHDDVICMLCMLCALKKAKHISEYIFESKQIKTSQRPRLCGPISAMAKNQHPPQPLTPSLPSRILSYSFSPKTKNCVWLYTFNSIKSHNKTIPHSPLSLSVCLCFWKFVLFCFYLGLNLSHLSEITLG